MSGPEILSPRLRISRLVASDAPALFDYRSDPEVCRYQSFAPRSLADAEAFIASQLPRAFDTAGTWFQLGIRLRDANVLIGDLGARFPADDPHQVEIGFTVDPGYQGRGLGTEAVASLVDHLLVGCRKHRVFASVDPRNEPSIRLLRRVGMRQEAHFRQSVWFQGAWVDDVVFGVLAAEWTGPSRSSDRRSTPQSTRTP